jgi:hypothetical protein
VLVNDAVEDADLPTQPSYVASDALGKLARLLRLACGGVGGSGGRVGGAYRAIECAVRQLFGAFDAKPAAQEISRSAQG